MRLVVLPLSLVLTSCTVPGSVVLVDGSMGAQFPLTTVGWCDQATFGPCVRRTKCVGGPTPSRSDFRSAGTLTVTLASGESHEVTQGEDGEYLDLSLRTSPGDLVKVSASGDRFPAFQFTQTMPPAIRLSGPLPSGVWPRNQPLPIRWEGAAHVRVLLNQPTRSVRMECDSAEGATSFDVPTQALDGLFAGPVQVSFVPLDEQDVAAGVERVHVSAVGSVSSATQPRAAGAFIVDLQ